MSAYQPTTGQACGCKRGVERDNCPQCEGTGQRIDFARIRAMSQPTPGPWTADARNVLTKQGLIVAICSADPNRSKTSAQANARLIAAAPELLAALIALEWKAGNVVASLEAVGKSCDGLKTATEQARAAIALAKGSD